MRISLGATINDLAQAMANVESGGSSTSLAARNNNPGNLVYAGQPGSTGKDANGFAIFSTYDAGYTAEVNQISLDLSRGTDINGNPTTTLTQLLSSWAPASAGNNPSAYAATVGAATGIDPNSPLLSVLSDGSGALTGNDSTVDTPDEWASLEDFSVNAVILGGLAAVGVLWWLSSK